MSATFVPPVPCGARGGAALRSRFVAPLPARGAPVARRASPPCAPLTPCARFFNDDRYAEWAAELFSPLPPTQVFGPAPPPARDFATAGAAFWANEGDLTVGELPVVRRVALSVARDIYEVLLDVRGTPWADGHDVPGQVLQLARNNKRGMFTIASPPGRRDTIAILYTPSDDPLKLRRLKAGDTIRVSMVLGSGIDSYSLSQVRSLHLFANSPQGFATIRSLLDWDAFRAATGSGANRTTRITMYYGMDSTASLPCADRISAWAMYAINVVPIVRQSLDEYLASGGLHVASLGSVKAGDAAALACIAELNSAEKLFVSLVTVGVERSSFHMYTENSLSKDLKEVLESTGGEGGATDRSRQFENWRDSGVWEQEPDFASEYERPHGMPEDVYEDLQRRYVEEQIWNRWVEVRDSMRAEFDKKWDQCRPGSRGARQAAEERAAKNQAWASWFAVNKDAWNASGQWEDVQWGSYWSGWNSEQTKWGAKWAEKTASNPWGSGSSGGWNQNNSQEFWNSARGGGSGGSGSYDRYSDGYGGSAGWGSSSTRNDSGGYKYTYNDPGGNSSSNSYSSRARDAWSGWSRQQSRTYAAGGGGGGYGGGGGGGRGGFGGRSQGMDLYRILGIDSSATAKDVKMAYRRAAKQNHPDVGGDTEKMKEVVIAYLTLKDSSKRQTYDRNGI